MSDRGVRRRTQSKLHSEMLKFLHYWNILDQKRKLTHSMSQAESQPAAKRAALKSAAVIQAPCPTSDHTKVLCV